MSLRRFAQTNNATASPRHSLPTPMTPSRLSENADYLVSPSPGARRHSVGVGFGTTTPTTPRTRISYSPTVSPSISASQPFDWEAVRLRKPPPYGGALHSARVRALRKSEANAGLRGSPGSPKKTVRTKSFKERIEAIPSNIMFEISLFPHNLPLPSPKTSARLIAGFVHFLHMCIRISHWRRLTDEDLPWADYLDESRGTSWFDWTTLTTVTLLLFSLYISFRYLTRTRPYNMHLRTEPLSSPHATFVSGPLNLDMTPSSRTSWFGIVFIGLKWIWRQLSVSWRFMWGMKMPPVDGTPYMNGYSHGVNSMYDANGERVERYQQLNVWCPDELESYVVVLYSPVHALIWSATTGSNWILMMAIMIIVSIQTHLLIGSYERLVKDKAIISAEVMHEYNEKFVNPRVYPIRKDASVMTHESEIVSIW